MPTRSSAVTPEFDVKVSDHSESLRVTVVVSDIVSQSARNSRLLSKSPPFRG